VPGSYQGFRDVGASSLAIHPIDFLLLKFRFSKTWASLNTDAQVSFPFETLNTWLLSLPFSGRGLGEIRLHMSLRGTRRDRMATGGDSGRNWPRGALRKIVMASWSRPGYHVLQASSKQESDCRTRLGRAVRGPFRLWMWPIRTHRM